MSNENLTEEEIVRQLEAYFDKKGIRKHIGYQQYQMYLNNFSFQARSEESDQKSLN